MMRFGKIAKGIIIAMIVVCFIGYGVMHYDGKEYGIEHAEEYVEKMCEISGVPGLSVVILNEEQEWYLNAGYADEKMKAEANDETQYELGSTTKAFTGVGILLLEQEGRLDRKDPVSKYLPWFAPTYQGEKAEVTIEQLLCHTSGIPVWTIATLPIGTCEDAGLLEETIRRIQTVELDNPPGKVHNYATINYDVLALIMEQVTGMSYEAYMEQQVLEPLGMSDSYFRVDDSQSPGLAQGYRYAFMSAKEYDAPTFYGNTAAGYLVSTTRDLAIWMKAQMGIYETERTDALEKINAAIIESHSCPSKEQNYWAGWCLYDSYFTHSGNNPNFSSQVIIDRNEAKAVFALTNAYSAAATTTADGIFRMLRGESVKIGFYVDEVALVDFVGVILCLTELYAGICIWERRNRRRRHAMVKAGAAMLGAVGIVVLPYLLHYNYLTLAVWYSPSVLMAIGGAVIVVGGYGALCVRGWKHNHVKRVSAQSKKY